MQFKHGLDRTYYHAQPCACDKYANARLKDLLELIDRFSKLTGEGDIVVTSYWRPKDTHSYHSILQAADIRSRDKSESWWQAMGLLSTALHIMDDSLQVYMHPELKGQAQEHIHVAIKDGKLAR